MVSGSQLAKVFANDNNTKTELALSLIHEVVRSLAETCDVYIVGGWKFHRSFTAEVGGWEMLSSKMRAVEVFGSGEIKVIF